ncbi:hypothetical protein HDU67_002860, partial [Dinochytrium kinnereticum]
GDAVKVAPKGYVKTHPNIEYLKMKNFTVKMDVTDDDVLSSDFVENAYEIFRVMHPFIALMNDFATSR